MARLTVTEVTTRVLRKMQDDAFDATDVLTALDQCNVEIATILDIKELVTVSEVTFTNSQNNITLPSDFCKNLFLGYNKTTNRHLDVYDSRRILTRRLTHLDRAGNVEAICKDGENIFYQKVPAADQTGDVHYHALPDDLASDGEFPSYVPGNFIHRLYYNYAVAQLFDLVEDGIDGEKVNTLYHEDKFNKYLREFELFIGPDPDDPYVPRTPAYKFDFEDYG